MKDFYHSIYSRKMLIFILLIFVNNICFSQQKRKLTFKDYQLWNTLQLGTASADGTWTSYSKSYLKKTDTLFLKNTATDVQFAFSGGHSEKITADGSLFAWLRNDSLFTLKPLTGKIETYPWVSQFELTKNGKYLIYHTADQVHKTLMLANSKTGRIEQFPNVTEYCLDPKQTTLALIQNSGNNTVIMLIDLKGEAKSIVVSRSDTMEFQNLTWNKTSNALACYGFDRSKNISTIVFASNSCGFQNALRLDSSVQDFPIDGLVSRTKLYVSDKGDKVFFDVLSKTNALEEKVLAKVWKSSDKELPPKTDPSIMHWQVWLAKSNKVYPIENENLKACALSAGGDKVLLLDNSRYLPLYQYNDRYSDVYLADLNTGERKKIIEKQLTAYHHLVSNKDGEYVAYFKDSNWWSYNIQRDLHTCLTKNLGTPFNKSTSDRLDQHQAYGFGGWTTAGELLLYDEFDIWMVAPDGQRKQKITNGKSLKIKYRLYEDPSPSIRSGFFGFSCGSYDLAEGLLIKTTHTEELSEGFGIWNSKTGFQQIVNENAKMLYVGRYGKKKDSFLFIESAFDVSPRIVSVDLKMKAKIIARSNEQQQKFHWGKAEIIHYQNAEGRKLNGALFYPAGYSSDKKFPLIVSIYEKKASTIHEYIPPSLENFDGLNITNLTSDGYFVLLPDITYTLNKAGRSALKCVLSAVDKAITTASIDENNMGLVGHSFGGFESTYIVGQTDRFKTVVAGAGVTDLLSFYLDIDSSNLSNMERFENAQFRNRVPFTENDFLSESPIMNVKGINTPLLLWTGENDQMVKSSYSIKMFAALWRLQKKSTLLIYPDEPHVIVNPVNQRDLTLKLTQWFDYQLKNSPKEDWMND